jgi:hypothetical protein
MIDANEMANQHEQPKAWEHLVWDAMPWPDEPKTDEEQPATDRDTLEHSA